MWWQSSKIPQQTISSSSFFVPPGAYIRSLEGELWGRVVCDQGRSWQLASGRTAKKEILGQTTIARWVMR